MLLYQFVEAGFCCMVVVACALLVDATLFVLANFGDFLLYLECTTTNGAFESCRWDYYPLKPAFHFLLGVFSVLCVDLLFEPVVVWPRGVARQGRS